MEKFGQTTRSNQLYERRLIRIGRPLFHIGILPVMVGHCVASHTGVLDRGAARQ